MDTNRELCRHRLCPFQQRQRTSKKRGPEKKIQAGEKCRVCGTQATGFNYGALNCNPCKSFFRRTVLDNNLFRQCDPAQCKRDIKRCISCRYARCIAVGMKPDYVRQLRIKSIQRRIDKIPKNKQLLNFSATLDPFQEHFLSTLEGFWLVYRDCGTSTNDVTLITSDNAVMQRTVSDVISSFSSKLSVFKLPNNDFHSKLEGLDYVKDYVDLHINMIRVFLEAIPSIRWHDLQEETKKRVVRYVAMEMPVMRGASRQSCGLLVDKNAEQFGRAGVSTQVLHHAFDIVKRFLAMEPDTYETCLIAALCATSPDRGIDHHTDYKILASIQETIFAILRIKLKIDHKPMRHLAAIIAFLQELRSYSFNSKREWLKFISHKHKIISRVDYHAAMSAEGEETSNTRFGIKYVCGKHVR